MPRYIDIHAHINFSAYDEDREAVIRRALDGGVWMINVGTQKDTSKRAVEIAEIEPEGVYATVGLHPIHTSPSFHDEEELSGNGSSFTSRGEIFDPGYYRSLAGSDKVVAIGECGLDYFHIEDEKAERLKRQRDAFLLQVELSLLTGKPLMIHCRPSSRKTDDAYDDLHDILVSDFRDSRDKLRGNVHFFAGRKETAQKFLDLGFTLSFTGVITFTRDYDEVIRYAPLSMIHADSDSPYVTPLPHRGERNEPLYAREIVEKIAEIKGLPLEELEPILIENAKKLFNLGG